MPRIILLQCRSCERELELAPAILTGIECPGCHHSNPLRVKDSMVHEGIVRNCVSCGHDALYIQKDFNRNTGVAIVAIGVLASIVFLARGDAFLAMLALVAAAVVDLLIYSLTGEVTVCYSCHTVYRGFEKNPAHAAFELKDLEKYGGREPRF